MKKWIRISFCLLICLSMITKVSADTIYNNITNKIDKAAIVDENGGGSGSGSSSGGTSSGSGSSNNNSTNNGDGDNSDFWAQANNWFSKGDKTSTTSEAQAIISQVSDMVNVIGTSVITLVTIFLGIKYMFGSAESRTSVKESLITLLVACVFFFGWNAIANILFPGNNFILNSSSDSSYKNLVGNIFSTGLYIAQFLVIIAILYIGIKYIFSGATGRADLKAKSGQFIIGIILAFATTNFLTFISKAVNEIL